MGHVQTAFMWSGHLVERIVMRYDRAIERERELASWRASCTHAHNGVSPFLLPVFQLPSFNFMKRTTLMWPLIGSVLFSYVLLFFLTFALA